MPIRALDLFQAYSQDKLPKDGGYIVSSFFNETSAYSRYEVVGYQGVKSIYLAEDGLTFQTDGNKMFVLVEPANYSLKHTEPVNRSKSEQIPHRFSEMDIHVSKNQSKVMVSKKPTVTYSSFTILKPTGINFALVFFNLPDVINSLEGFFGQTLHKEAGIPTPDAKKAAKLVTETVKAFSIW